MSARSEPWATQRCRGRRFAVPICRFLGILMGAVSLLASERYRLCRAKPVSSWSFCGRRSFMALGSVLTFERCSGSPLVGYRCPLEVSKTGEALFFSTILPISRRTPAYIRLQRAACCWLAMNSIYRRRS